MDESLHHLIKAVASFVLVVVLDHKGLPVLCGADSSVFV